MPLLFLQEITDEEMAVHAQHIRHARVYLHMESLERECLAIYFAISSSSTEGTVSFTYCKDWLLGSIEVLSYEGGNCRRSV